VHNSSRTMEMHTRAPGNRISVNRSCRLRTGEQDRRRECSTSSSRPGTHETQARLALAIIARSEQSNASGQYGPFPSHSKEWAMACVAVMQHGAGILCFRGKPDRSVYSVSTQKTPCRIRDFIRSFPVLQIECASLSTTWKNRQH
jgi:hypothetical protein